VAKLNNEETRLLKRLQDKAKAPDAPPSTRSLNISIDLGDAEQVSRAQKLGLLDAFAEDDGGGGDDDNDNDDDGGDDPPKRRGYFGS